jgi:uncharacterized membrane protein YeaQ/YmgE (transglycosylase-associated protein family)
MIWFELFTWLSFGAIAGLWWGWFRPRHRHLLELMAVGMVGGLLGGAFGRAVAGTLKPLTVDGYNLVALVCAVAGAAAVIYVDVVRFRRRRRVA